MKTPCFTPLFHLIIRVPKEQAAFTYFTLEANENLCFFSTIDESCGQTFRDVDIKGSMDTQEEVCRLLNFLSKKYPLAILKTASIQLK